MIEYIEIEGIKYPFLFSVLAYLELENKNLSGLNEVFESLRLGFKDGALDQNQPEPDWEKMRRAINREPKLLAELADILKRQTEILGEQLKTMRV